LFGSGTVLDVNPRATSVEYPALESKGHEVIVCRGPGVSRRCPLVEEGSCALVDAADGVVFRLDLDDPYNRDILRCYREDLGETSPIHIVVAAGQESRHARILSGFVFSVDEIGTGLSGLSSQVAMAAAARIAVTEPADPTRHS